MHFVTGTEAGLQVSSFTLRHLLRGKLRQDCLGTFAHFCISFVTGLSVHSSLGWSTQFFQMPLWFSHTEWTFVLQSLTNLVATITVQSSS